MYYLLVLVQVKESSIDDETFDKRFILKRFFEDRDKAIKLRDRCKNHNLLLIEATLENLKSFAVSIGLEHDRSSIKAATKVANIVKDYYLKEAYEEMKKLATSQD